MNDFRLTLETGSDVPVPELQIVIHSPTIKEIGMMGEQQYFMAIQYLCLQKEQLVKDESLLSILTNFQVLMRVLEQSQDKDKKTAIVMALKLLFPDRMATMTKNSIILASTEEGVQPILIDDNNFEIFQSVIKEVTCASNLFQGKDIVYNPKSKKAKEIAAKIMRGRQKVAELKHQGGTQSVLTRYVSIISVALHLDVNVVRDYNLFQIFDLMDRYNAWLEWDTDLRLRLAGGKPDKQIESWMRDLHP